jgi:hypothetical protein
LVDIRRIIFGLRVCRPVRDEALFLTDAIAEDGDAVAWNGDGLLMSADTIRP